MIACLSLALSFQAIGTVVRQESSSAAAPAIVLPANTPVELELAEEISSGVQKPGDFFKLRVAIAVKSGDRVLIPVETPVVGQVVHSAKASGGGKAGELILAARYLDLPQGRAKLRSWLGAAAPGRTGTALAAAMAIGPFAMMIKGRQTVVPTGTVLSARLAADTPFSPTP